MMECRKYSLRNPWRNPQRNPSEESLSKFLIKKNPVGMLDSTPLDPEREIPKGNSGKKSK